MSKTRKIINELLVDLFNDILEIEERALREKQVTDLSMSEIHTIEAIGCGALRTMSEIAEQLRITLGTLTTAINRLVKKGYVDRLRSESDRRIVFAKLTEKGEEVFRKHEEFHSEMIEKMVAGLKVDEDRLLIESLEKLQEFLKTKI